MDRIPINQQPYEFEIPPPIPEAQMEKQYNKQQQIPIQKGSTSIVENGKRDGIDLVESGVADANDGKVKKKQKKQTSLQGRPAKANEDLRKLEDQIKLAAWRMAEFEENLYIVHGGASVKFTDDHNYCIMRIVEESSCENAPTVELFQMMISKRKQVYDNPQDPLGEKFVPLSDKYFMEIIMGQRNYLSLDELMLIYAFQVYLRTNLEGFKVIFDVLVSIANAAYAKTNVAVFHVGTHLSVSEVQKLVQTLEKNSPMITMYTALHTVMKESVQTYNNEPQIIAKDPERSLKIKRDIEGQKYTRLFADLATEQFHKIENH